MVRFEFNAIGTAWEVDTPGVLAHSVKRRIVERIETFDATYSRFRADSLVAGIAKAETGGQFTFPDDAAPLFDLYDRLHAATDGAVDPLVGRDLELSGYDAGYSLAPDLLGIERYTGDRRSWNKDTQRHGCRIDTQRPVVIDVGAAGKGYLVDIVAAILRDEGIHTFVVDGGGDMLHAGSGTLDVGLEHPSDPKLVAGIAHLGGRALCASAVNRRAWGAYHHVVDGRTGVPVRNVVATWVVADNAMTADGLATALFFTGADRLAETFDFSFVRMFADGRAEIPEDFPGELFT